LLNIDYQYSYSDVPAEARVRTRFVSLSKRELCVGRETWPSSGYLSTNDGTSNGVYLVVAQRIYAFKDTQHWALCREKSCYNPLGKGESLDGYLPYADFQLPESEFLAKKELKYKPQPFWCDQGHFLGQ
jgi:hypothetical protein